MQQENLNYGVLSEPVTKADIQAYRAVYLKPSIVSVFIIFGLGIIFLGAAIIGLVSSADNIATGIGVSIFLLMFVGALAVIVLADRSNFKKKVKLFKFAQLNGISLLIDRQDPPYTGMIFGVGHSKKVKEGLVFPDGTELGNYTYATGGGKNRREYHWGYIRVPLTRKLPHMVLDAKKNNYLKRFSNLGQAFSKNQILKLEGDFNDYFTLYAPKQYETDALYVFTPDVMAALIDFGADYDVEIIEDNFIMYATNHLPLSSGEHLKRMLAVTNTLSSELRDQSRRYADVRVADSAANIVAQPGKRLKSGIGAMAIILFIVIMAYAAWMIFSNLQEWS